MAIEVRFDTHNVDWAKVSALLKSVGMAHHAPEKHQQAFAASYCTVFLYDQEMLIGCGRAISDGVYQAALYDCAIAPQYQRQGLGRRIIQEMLTKLPDCNIILYASPGKEDFYRKQGFRLMKTGMAFFVHQETMTIKGFTE